ncbi:DUF3408 domain-containing protein [Petrimonas sulfuriphila]|jgi:hypothetical protein|uniref:DUF3408 domain-containing protein n=1 Tax=Petrimonas sulfuriphila TaxID=285070 RepID=UPI003F50E289
MSTIEELRKQAIAQQIRKMADDDPTEIQSTRPNEPLEKRQEKQNEKPFVNKVQTEPSKPTQQSTEPETIVARRNSQKQRKASLEEYKNKFLHPPKITDRKTVYLSADIRDRLDEIVRRLGERGSSVSGFIENMAKNHLDTYQEEIELWKKL